MFALHRTSAIPRRVLALTGAVALLMSSMPMSTYAEFVAINSIPNASVENALALSSLPTGWGRSRSGRGLVRFSFATDTFDGGRGLRIDLMNIRSGAAQWYFQSIPVTAGETYSFADYYRSNVTTRPRIRYIFENGRFVTELLGSVPSTDGEWKRMDVTFTPPKGAVLATIMHTIARTGYLETDAFTLLQGTGALLVDAYAQTGSTIAPGAFGGSESSASSSSSSSLRIGGGGGGGGGGG